MSKLTAEFKKVRKALKLPPLTIGNAITKYGPAAAMAATGNPMGAAATMYGGGAVSKPRAMGNPTFPTWSAPGGGMPTDTPYGKDNWLESILKGAGGAIGKGVQYAKDNPGNVAMGALAAARALQAAKASARQGKLTDEAIGLSKERWAGGAPLRTAGQAGLLKPRAAVDYNSIFADPTNPFAAKKRPMTPTRPVPAPTGPIGPPPNRLPSSAPPPKNRAPLGIPRPSPGTRAPLGIPRPTPMQALKRRLPRAS